MRRFLTPFIVALAASALLFNYLSSFKIIPEKINLEIELQAFYDDTFQVFFKNQENDKYVETNSEKIRVKGDSSFQKVYFTLPIDEPITSLRIDIGTNKNQGPMRINYVALTAENTRLVYDIGNDFEANGFIKLEGNIITTHSVHQTYDPYFISNFNTLSAFETLTVTRNTFSKGVKILLCCLAFFTCFIALYFHEINWKLQSVYIIVFCLILSLPTIIKFFDIEINFNVKEKRKLAEMPEIKVTEEFPEKYEDYYNDNFSLRNALVGLSSAIKINYLKISPRPESVLFGKEGFMFYNKRSDAIYESYSNRNIVDEKVLKDALEKHLKIKKTLDARNIKYVMGFFPNKHTVYKEFLPFKMKIQVLDSISLADQISTYFSDNGLQIVDVRGKLIDEKDQNQLYYKFDTHWNAYGAFVAYQEFCKQTYEQLALTPYSISDFEITYSNRNSGDLTGMLGINAMKNYHDSVPEFHLIDKTKTYKVLKHSGWPYKTVITENESCGNSLTALVFRDSYTTALIPYLSLHYKKVVYIWQDDINAQLIEKVQPDIVMKLNVERYLNSFFAKERD